MAQVIYVACPQCQGQFYVGPEFFSIPESYCHCPYCEKEFSVYEKRQNPESRSQNTGG
jgi:uncharacterized protein YbaR (Trm112 family)